MERLTAPPPERWRYYRHSFNFDYGAAFEGSPNLIEGQLLDPTPSTRFRPGHIGLEVYASGPLRVEVGKHLVDYYRWGHSCIFLSDRFHSLYRELDPDGIDSRRFAVAVIDEQAIRQYWMVMPIRVLDAIDLDATSFTIGSRAVIDGLYLRWARFANACAFRDEVTKGTPSFIDFNSDEWVWSESFISAVVAAGIRGFCTAEASQSVGTYHRRY